MSSNVCAIHQVLNLCTSKLCNQRAQPNINRPRQQGAFNTYRIKANDIFSYNFARTFLYHGICLQTYTIVYRYNFFAKLLNKPFNERVIDKSDINSLIDMDKFAELLKKIRRKSLTIQVWHPVPCHRIVQGTFVRGCLPDNSSTCRRQAAMTVVAKISVRTTPPNVTKSVLSNDN